MPAPTTCPITEVDRALSIYINTREDTTKIRRSLSKYLTASLRPVNVATQNQHLNHECPQNIYATQTNPPGLAGSRLQYLQAVRAHKQAQAKHLELQTSLATLQQRHTDENPTPRQSDYDNEATRAYVSLLRQRQRLAELQVIQNSLENLLSARPSQAHGDPKDLVKHSLGEQPSLPAERLERIAQIQDHQTPIFKLKQEVLEARSGMDRSDAARKKAQTESRGLSTLQQQVYALEKARDEIVEWIQGELAKMEEDSVFLEDASPIKRNINDAAPVDLASAGDRIRQAYDKYTASRGSLVESYKNLQQRPQLSNEQGSNDEKRNEAAQTSQEDLRPSFPITKIFPHLPHLARTANNERSLLQQSVYLQNQISSADQEIGEALLRLSGESHLLLPASSIDVAAWGKVAAEAETATADFIEEQLQAGRQGMSAVDAVVELSLLQNRVLGSM
jgi:hypothetical protein